MPSAPSVHPSASVHRPRHRGGRGRKRSHSAAAVVVMKPPSAARHAPPNATALPAAAPGDARQLRPRERVEGEAPPLAPAPAAAAEDAAAAAAPLSGVSAVRAQAQATADAPPAVRVQPEPDGPATGSVRVSVPPEASAVVPQRTAAAGGGAARPTRSKRPRTRSFPEASPGGDSPAVPLPRVPVALQSSQPAPGVPPRAALATQTPPGRAVPPRRSASSGQTDAQASRMAPPVPGATAARTSAAPTGEQRAPASEAVPLLVSPRAPGRHNNTLTCDHRARAQHERSRPLRRPTTTATTTGRGATRRSRLRRRAWWYASVCRPSTASRGATCGWARARARVA